MNMNLFNYKKLLPLLCIPVVFASCKKWLDVTPANQTKEEEQFSNRQGYVDALFGAYQIAAFDAGYGHQASFGFLDVLAQRYENKTNSNNDYFGQAARYNYMSASNFSLNVQNIVNGIWNNMYRTISQANLILSNIDQNRSVLSDQDYAIVKGEALALRGYLHFDLIRMYGPAYMDGANADALSVPYMEAFTVQPRQRLSLAAAVDLCIADLKAADVLLSQYPDIDQIASNQGATSAELLTMFRQNHLNNWAVKATIARAYQYMNQKDSAYMYALQVVNSEKFAFINPASLNVDPNSEGADLTFSPEHIFSIYRSDMKTVADMVFKSATGNTGEASDYFTTRAKLEAMYETSQTNYGTDIRNPNASRSLWNPVSASVVYSKKYHSDNASNVKQRLVPLIRLPEMYYIAAESASTLEEGFSWLNVVREARLLPALPVGSTENLNAELLKEYRKEFYGEGQLWFYYKRKNTITIPDGVGNPMNETKYVFPLPNNEIEFGR